MPKILFHSSHNPGEFQDQLKSSLRVRRLNHRFHYQTAQQAEKWHKLHEAFAPSDLSHTVCYSSAFRDIAKLVSGTSVQVLGLCCGYAEKEGRLLQQLRAEGSELSFVVIESSEAMASQALATVGSAISKEKCRGFVCDLETSPDLAKWLAPFVRSDSVRHVFSFTGTLHNFEPDYIFPLLASVVRCEDLLLMSANLAPGENYFESLRKILPQYDNCLTFDWLGQALWDLGLAPKDGEMRAAIESSDPDRELQRIVICFDFLRKCHITCDGEKFTFSAGESLRLFYSYRYTPMLVQKWLRRSQLELVNQWISESGTEGVFLCRRQSQDYPA